MKYLKDFLQVVSTEKAPLQICSFDAKTGWGLMNSPLPTPSGPLLETHEDLVGTLEKTHKPFWGSCECCCDEGLILYRPRVAGQTVWLAYVRGRGAYELVLLSDFSSAMEFMRLYAPGLMSIPDHHPAPALLEEMLDCVALSEPSPPAAILQ
jgi:hypothetical protein